MHTGPCRPARRLHVAAPEARNTTKSSFSRGFKVDLFKWAPQGGPRLSRSTRGHCERQRNGGHHTLGAGLDILQGATMHMLCAACFQSSSELKLEQAVATATHLSDSFKVENFTSEALASLQAPC